MKEKGISIYKKGKFYLLEYRLNGKRFRKSLKTEDKKEAEEKARGIINLAKNENRKDLIKEIAKVKGLELKSISLEDAWKIWLNSPERGQIAETTMVSYLQYYAQFKEKIDCKYINEVNTEKAKDFCNFLLSTGIKPQTYNKKRNFFESFFKIIAYDSDLVENPFSSILNRRKEAYEGAEISEKEVKGLIAHHKGENKALFAIGAFTGCRLKDACLLKWENIDLEELVIKFKPAKTINKNPNKYVLLPVLPDLQKILESIKGLDECYLLPTWKDIYIKDRTVAQQTAKRLMKEAGVNVTGRNGKKDGVRGFHALRHYFVSYCANNGVPFAIVQALVGHGSPAMTSNYTHIDIEIARQALIADDDKVKKKKIIDIAKTLDDLKLRDKLLKIINK